MRVTPGRPVETETPTLVVDAGLPAGVWRVRLVVVNSRGEKSQPVDVAIRIVKERGAPITDP